MFKPRDGDWKKRALYYGEKAIKVGSDLAEIVVHLPAKPGPLAVAVAGSRVVNTLLDLQEEKQPERYFGKGWDHLRNVGSLGDYLLSVCISSGIAEEIQEASSDRGTVIVAEANGFRYGWIKYESWTSGPWTVKDTDATEALHNLGRLVWEFLGPNVKVIQKPLVGVIIVQDSLKDTLPSPDGEALHKRLADFNEHGFNRSALLLGEPGTGKSHIMRYVCKLAGGLSLRFPAREIGDMDDVATPIAMLCPNAVLVDDLDRCKNPEAILTQIEDMKESTQMLLCSINDVTDLDPAVLRVGRFDEFVEIESLDMSVRRDLIGADIPPEIVKQLLDLPIAAIEDFRKRRVVLGDKQAIIEVAELVERTEMIRELAYGDDEDDDNPPDVSKGRGKVKKASRRKSKEKDNDQSEGPSTSVLPSDAVKPKTAIPLRATSTPKESSVE